MPWLIGIGLLIGALLLWLRSFLARIPIGLSSVQTSGTSSGTEVIVSVARRDPLLGLTHGAAPQLSHAWVSDDNGHELPLPLSPLNLSPSDGLGGLQWGWRIPKIIKSPAERVVFHVMFTAPGAEPFEFQQAVHAGVDFNGSKDSR